ncbi:MAG: PAS domain S-box protein [Bacteroidetes bacterium]|nr:PAS domain S-box protein [Bacteroidota bacterium]
MRILLLEDDQLSSARIMDILNESSSISELNTGKKQDLKMVLSQNAYDILLIGPSAGISESEAIIFQNKLLYDIPVMLLTLDPDQDKYQQLLHKGLTEVISLDQPADLLRALQRSYNEVILKRKLAEMQTQLDHARTAAMAQKFPEIMTSQSGSEADFAQLIFSSIRDSIAAIDSDGTIIYTNQSWKDFALNSCGMLIGSETGANYFDICKSLANDGDEQAERALEGIQAVIKNEKTHFELQYRCHSLTNKRWLLMHVTPFRKNRSGALITLIDITDKKNKELELEFSNKELLTSERINSALISGESTEKLTSFMLESLYESMGIQRSRIYLYDKAAHKLDLYASRISGEVIKKLEKRAGITVSSAIPKLVAGSLFNQVISENKILVTNNENEIIQIIGEHAPNAVVRKLAKWAFKLIGIQTFTLIPLTKEDEVVGLLSVATPFLLNERERQTLLRFAQQVSLVISRKLDQDELLNRNAKLKAISDHTANWENWLDTTGKPIWINPAVFNHSGYTAEELLNMPDFYEKVIHKDDFERVMLILQDALINKTEGENLEVRSNHKDGSVKWFSICWKQVFDENGKWIGIRTSGMDITQRKEQEIELLRKQQELNEVHEVARLGSWEWLAETKEISFSPNLCRILQIPTDQQVYSQTELLRMMYSESRHRLERAILNSMENFKPTDIELRIRDYRGNEKYLLIRAAKASIDGGITHGTIHGSALDITELKLTHNQVRESQERFRKIFESIQDVYYQTDRDGIITLVSPSIQNLLGYTPEEVVGHPISILYTKPKQHELKMGQRNMQGDKEQFEASLLSKNGDEVFVSINLSFLPGHTAGHEIVQGLMRNITEKKKQEKSLENQRKRLLEIVKLNTQIIQTSDHFYYVIQITDLQSNSMQLKYVSTPVTTILGLTELDLLNRENRWKSLIHPEDAGLLENAIDLVFKEKRPQKVSYRITHNRSGETIWLDDYICPLLNGNNDVVEIYGSVKDVSERVNMILKIESEKRQSIAYQYQLLSSQLNPHFIYNTLNTFQFYILQGNIEESLNHISDFSKLMRKVLENSMYNYISLDEEIEFLEHYMRISKQRMKEPLEFTIHVEEGIETADVMIPPMLLQPYLENAMIHGFHECPRKPVLKLIIQKKDHLVQCIIEDNGIGREKSILSKGNRSPEIKRSYAMGINKNRIDLLNQITEQNFEVIVEDLKDGYMKPIGTRVYIRYREVINDIHL